MDVSIKEYIHVRTKSLYAGANEVLAKEDIIFEDGTIKSETFRHSPCYYHCVTEIITNAYDNLIKSYNKDRVNTISVERFGDKFVVKNDGKGIDVLKRKHIDDKTYWNPFLIFTELRTGSNMVEKGKIVGGENGFGSKIVVYNSNYFKIKTYDAERKIYYEQEFTCSLKSKETPLEVKDPIIIKDYKGSFKGTEITFRLDSKFLGYKDIKEDKNLIKHVKAVIYLLDFHVKSLGFDVSSFLNYECIGGEPKYLFKEQTKVNDCIFNIYMGTDFNANLINNLICGQKSTNVNAVKQYINNKLKGKLTAFCKEKRLTTYNIKKIFGNINMIVSCQIPDIKPSSQRKDIIEFDETRLKDFSLSDKFLSQVYDSVCLVLSSKTRKVKVAKPEYVEAGIKTGFTILLTEGKHSRDMVNIMLNSMERKKYAIFDLGGVVINAYKELVKISLSSPRSLKS